MTQAANWLITGAGLAGAAGVALAAAASHLDPVRIDAAEREALKTAAQFLLFHAPALLAIGLWLGFGGGARLVLAAGVLLLLGMILFVSGLSLPVLTGATALRRLAPSGGSLMILGWLMVVIAAWGASRN